MNTIVPIARTIPGHLSVLRTNALAVAASGKGHQSQREGSQNRREGNFRRFARNSNAPLLTFPDARFATQLLSARQRQAGGYFAQADEAYKRSASLMSLQSLRIEKVA
jgi:hypothetical protein